MLLFNFILRPKVVYPKYYQYRNEYCNFAFVGQIGPNHTFEFIFHIFMGKMNSKPGNTKCSSIKKLFWAVPFLALIADQELIQRAGSSKWLPYRAGLWGSQHLYVLLTQTFIPVICIVCCKKVNQSEKMANLCTFWGQNSLKIYNQL
jgi:hypothetical protein